MNGLGYGEMGLFGAFFFCMSDPLGKKKSIIIIIKKKGERETTVKAVWPCRECRRPVRGVFSLDEKQLNNRRPGSIWNAFFSVERSMGPRLF